LRPVIDHLESRSLLATTPLVAYPTFEIGRLAASGVPPFGAYTPAQIQEAYGFNNITFGGVVGNGSGETIAIVDADNDPHIQADLNTFDTQFGLPATTVAVYDENGGTNYPASDPTGGWELEESLDVEWAHAMAPGASIMLVEASSANDGDLLAAVDYAAARANVVSMSWAGSEFPGETASDTQDFDRAGVAFVAASGDSGAPAAWPAASPNVLSVGGTALTLGPGNVWSSEVGWSGSGGGPSAYESQPPYQQGVVTQTSSARATPDVAYDASPSTGVAVYDSIKYEGTTYGWLEVGGTSAGAPQWSALLAIADQGRASSGQPALDSTSPQDVMKTLYENPADFHDITSGTSAGIPEYFAGPGYDYVTGLGSPMANLIVGSLDGASTVSNDKLVLAAPTAETAGTSFSLTVTAQNSSGATDTGYLGTIDFTSSDVRAGLPANFTFTAADNGTYTFTVTLRTAGTQSITATDTTTSAITGTLSGISVSPALASQLVLSGLPSTTSVGESQTVTATAEDPYRNVATAYRGTVQFTSSDTQASLPANYMFTAADQGVHVFTLTLDTLGTQSVTVTDTASGFTATQSGITVRPAAAQTFTIAGFPVVDTAGGAGNVTVTAYDAYGDVATGYTGTVSLSSSDPRAVLPSSYNFVAADAGKHTFSVTLETAGTQTITATDTVTASLTATESNIAVKPAAASTLKVTGFPASDMAGAAGNVVVTAYDAYGNVATGYTGTVSLTSSDPHAVLPSSLIFPGTTGTQAFAVTLETAGAQSITATDTVTSSITGAESGITVQAAAAKTLTIGFPTSDTAGAAGNVVVMAHDAYGNVATGYTGTVSLASSDPQAILVPSSYTFVAADAGKRTFAATLETAGAQSITATDTVTSSITGAESGIMVHAAAAKTLTIAGFPTSDTAGAAGNVVVTVYDAYGNVATGYTGTVSLTTSDPHAVQPSGYTFVAADAGKHTFSVTLETAGTQTITATDMVTASLTATESNIAVTPAAASILKVTGFPASDTAGAAGNVVVTVYDAYGNLAAGYTGTVHLTSSDPRAVLPSSFTFPGTTGTQAFAVTLETAGAQSITATDTVTSSITGAESGITVHATAAKTLMIAGFPTNDTAGANGDVVVTAYDAYANVATGYTGNVFLASSDPQAILVPSNYTFVAADAGKHTFFVTLETAGTHTIAATDTASSNLTATESNIAVRPATASILTVTGFPTSDTAGAAGNVVVTAYDAYGNVATGYTGTVYLTSSDPQAVLPSGFTFPGTTGTHSFAVTLETPGAQSITATDAATSSITGTEPGIAVRATPQITWSAPASIVYGTPLGTAQLDGSANVPGTFAYTPAAGAILDVDSGQTLSVTFTPQDATDYTPAAATTTITINQATPILEVADAGGRFDGSPFPASVTIAGAVAGVDSTPAPSLDNVTPTLTYDDGSGTAGTSLGPAPPSAPGTYTVVAAYPGNVEYSAVLSTPLTFTIGQGAATLALASSGGSAVYGQPVSFIATVGAVAGTPTGTVTFSDGTTRLATVPLDGSGTATFTTGALSLGSHSITATYNGDADFLGVQSAPYSETVAQTGTEVVAVEQSVFRKKKLLSVRLTAAIKPSAPGGGVPTGTVTFELVAKTKNHAKVTKLRTAAVNGGEATLALVASQVPQKAITIVYSGDANDKASTGTTPKLT